jgi:hypothetical protein
LCHLDSTRPAKVQGARSKAHRPRHASTPPTIMIKAMLMSPPQNREYCCGYQVGPRATHEWSKSRRGGGGGGGEGGGDVSVLIHTGEGVTAPTYNTHIHADGHVERGRTRYMDVSMVVGVEEVPSRGSTHTMNRTRRTNATPPANTNLAPGTHPAGKAHMVVGVLLAPDNPPPPWKREHAATLQGHRWGRTLGREEQSAAE